MAYFYPLTCLLSNVYGILTCTYMLAVYGTLISTYLLTVYETLLYTYLLDVYSILLSTYFLAVYVTPLLFTSWWLSISYFYQHTVFAAGCLLYSLVFLTAGCLWYTSIHLFADWLWHASVHLFADCLWYTSVHLFAACLWHFPFYLKYLQTVFGTVLSTYQIVVSVRHFPNISINHSVRTVHSEHSLQTHNWHKFEKPGQTFELHSVKVYNLLFVHDLF